MYWQRRYLLRTTTLSVRDGTWRLSLPTSNILSGILLKVSMTNGSTSNVDHDVLESINRIRVIANGSDVIYSLRPEEIYSKEWFATGKRMPMWRTMAPNDIQWAVFPIRFGRFFTDPNYWLRCSDYNSLDLEVDLAFSDIANDGWADVYPTVEVAAWMAMEGTPGSRAGFIRTTEFDSTTTPASGSDDFDVPQYHSVPYIYVYCREDNVEDGVDVTDVEVKLNNGERIPFTANWLDLQDENKIMFNIEPVHSLHLFRSDTDTVDVRMTRIQSYTLMVNEDVNISNDTFILDRIDTISGNRLTINSSQVDVTAGAEDLTAYTTDHDMYLEVRGAAAPHVVCIPFAVHGDLQQSLDTTAWDDVTVTLNYGAAGGTVYLFFDEIVS